MPRRHRRGLARAHIARARRRPRRRCPPSSPPSRASALPRPRAAPAPPAPPRAAPASSPRRRDVRRRSRALLPARRDALARGAVAFAAASLLSLAPGAAFADSLPEEEPTRLLCDASCEAALADVELVTTKSGLQYKDIVVGDGVQPEVGFQCVVDYIAKNEKGQIFDNSLEKGKPNDIRVTGDPESANVIPGLDEGLLTMRSGGIRRLYIPGELAFPKGLASAPGRPRIAPYSPVVFDVKLIYIPGME